MSRRVYTIVDKLSGQCGPLVVFPADAPAVRMFGDVLSNPETMPGKHPEDYDLVVLGELWEDPKAGPMLLVQEDGVQTIITGKAWAAARTGMQGGEG